MAQLPRSRRYYHNFSASPSPLLDHPIAELKYKLSGYSLTLSQSSDLFWQIAESALQLCRAGIAGISILDTEDGAEVFKEQTVAVLSGRLATCQPM